MVVIEQNRKANTGSGIGRKPAHLKSSKSAACYEEYLEDVLHINHTQKRIKGIRHYNGEKHIAEAEFKRILTNVEMEMTKREKCGRGRKRKWLAKVFIASTEHRAGIIQKNTDGDVQPMLSEDEQLIYERRFIEEGGFGACAVCWHIDRESGRCDCHLIVINALQNDFSRALAPWQVSIVRRRIASDLIEREINHARKKAGIKDALRSIAEVRVAKKREKNIDDLAEQLGSLANAPISIGELPRLIAGCGHRVSRFNDTTISVVHKDKKRAFRYDVLKLISQAEANRLGKKQAQNVEVAIAR